MLKKLKNARSICVDVETSGLDWKRNHIVGYVVTFSAHPHDSHYIPVRHRDGGNLNGSKGPQESKGWDGKLVRGEKELIAALDRPELMLFGHNFSFDLKFLSRVGFKMNPRFEDTILNEPLIDEFAPKFGLAECAERHHVAAKKSKVMYDHLASKFPEASGKSAMGHYWRLDGDDPIAVDYAVSDGTATWQLREKQMALIEKQDLKKVWDIECRLLPILVRMSIHGIRIDEDYLGRLQSYLDKEIERLLGEFPDGFSARSATDVRRWMEKHGHTDWPLTEKKMQPSFPESWLEQYPAGQQIIRIRKLSNLKNSFVTPLYERHLFNGRVHTNYNQLKGDQYGTITGRLSSDEPNLQAVPKHNEELGWLFRSAFIPDDGMIWGSADYSQCEPRLLAEYSGCRALREGYLQDPPIDAHTAAAQACLGARWDEMSETEQKYYRNMYAKRINQTIITGGGKNVIVKKYKVPESEIDRVWTEYHRAMPEIRALQKEAQRRMTRNGYVTTLLDRRCRVIHGREYVGLNRLLQGGNADILKLKLVEAGEYLRSEGDPIHLLNNCHDATDFQWRPENRKYLDETLRIMQSFGPDDVISLNLPMPLDMGEGPNWAVASYGDKGDKLTPKPLRKGRKK